MQEAATQGADLSFLGLLFLVIMCVLTWTFQRRYAPIPLLITTCYMPLGQALVLAGLHFQFLRVLLLLGIVRVWVRGEGADLRLTYLDRLFITWGAATLVMGTLNHPSFDRFINRSGEVFNAFGTYFLFRCWMRELKDVLSAVRLIAVLLVPLAISMAIEKVTRHNIFSVFGGVPEITLVREGKLRCQGAFRHPILAGTFAATSFPLCIALWFRGGRDRSLGLLGAVASLVCTVAAASSGALFALMGTGLGLGLWWFRTRMRLVRWGTVLGIVGLAFVMKAPVWYLFSRLSEVAGGTGWYRSYIIDQAISHFNEWWLVGSANTASWAPAGEVTVGDPNNMDIINQFVAEGLGGGILKLGLFVAMIVQGFKVVGRCMSDGRLPRQDAIMVWAFGVSLFAHCLSFFSVSYFDQIIVIWYWLLAVMAALFSVAEIQSFADQTSESAGAVPVEASPPADSSGGLGGQCFLVAGSAAGYWSRAT